MNTISFRFATLNDLPSIVAIYNATIPSRIVTADVTPVSIADKLAWFRAHDSKHRPLWVAADSSGQIVGWLSFQSFYGRPAYEKTIELSIYLDERVRGKGLGSYCLSFAENEAKARGITNIMGFIFEHNIPSIQLFEKYGFERWGKFPNIAAMDGELYSLAVYGKAISL
jgi:L-amino acid N-acyltransferase YncA